MRTLSVKYSTKLVYLDDEDFERISKYTWHYNHRSIYRYASYKQRYIQNEVLRDHSITVDHISRDEFDNRRCNLRKCSVLQNLWNRECKRLNKASRYKGVCYHKKNKCWVARIIFKGEQISLGCFKDEILAAIAYDDAAIEKFGKFAKLNFQLYGA